ncbi:hypothetical protein RYX36_025694 [Vicia faba]
MSCITFNVATSFNLNGCIKNQFSKPIVFRNHSSFPKSSTHLSKPLNLSLTNPRFTLFDTRTPVFKCAAQSSDPSASPGVETKNNSERVDVLVIGGGGREHALCYALQRSPSCDTVFCAPGNAGIASSGNATCISDLDVNDGAAVESFCRKWGVGLVIVGPEAPLCCTVILSNPYPFHRYCRHL